MPLQAAAANVAVVGQACFVGNRVENAAAARAGFVPPSGSQDPSFKKGRILV